MPSLSSSPWILGAPHNGLAILILRISRRISNGTVGRPQRRRDFQRQYDRKRTTGLREQPIKTNENQSVN
jgi:hypothetical protein